MILACVVEVGVVDQSAWNVDLPEEALVLVKVIRIMKTAVIKDIAYLRQIILTIHFLKCVVKFSTLIKN